MTNNYLSGLKKIAKNTPILNYKPSLNTCCNGGLYNRPEITWSDVAWPLLVTDIIIFLYQLLEYFRAPAMTSMLTKQILIYRSRNKG